MLCLVVFHTACGSAADGPRTVDAPPGPREGRPDDSPASVRAPDFLSQGKEQCARAVKGRSARGSAAIDRAGDAAPMDPELVRRVSTLQAQGLVEAADTLLLDALCRFPGNQTKLWALHTLAQNRETAGDPEGAIWFLEKSRDVMRIMVANSLESMPAAARARATPAVRPQENISMVLKLARLYAELGDSERARAELSQADALARGGPGAEDQHLAELSEIYGLLGDMASARQRARAWEQAVGVTGPPQSWRPGAHSIFDRWGQLAAIIRMYVDAGDLGEVERLAAVAERALAAPDIATGVRDGQFARRAAELNLHLSLVIAAIATGDGVTAIRHLDAAEARQVAMQRGFPGHDLAGVSREGGVREYVWRSNNGWRRGQAYALQGKTREAATALRETVDVIEHLRGFVRPADRVAFFGQHTGPYLSLVDVLLSAKPGDAPAQGDRGRTPAELAFYYAEAARARLLSERMAQSSGADADRTLPAAIAEREAALRSALDAELQRGYRIEDAPSYSQFQALVEELRRTHPAYATLKYPVPLGARQVALRDGEVMLAYSLLERRVAVWLLQKGKDPQVFVVPVARGEVLSRIGALRAALEPQSAADLRAYDAKAGSDLHEWLLAGPLKDVPRHTRVIVVPDGALGTIPLDVLAPARPDGSVRFAGEDYTFAYAPSATVFTHQRNQHIPPGRGGRALIVADPLYESAGRPGDVATASADARLAAARGGALRTYASMRHIAVFSRLPGTRREAVAVARELGIPADSGDIRLGLAAGEHEVKTLDLTAYRYLHFATHGVLAEDVPYLRQPALVLSQAGDLRGEDGFLTVGEILSLRLQADLTVLSACQTGLGQEVTGEGVVGLTRAFLYAGTRAAVVSLWRVEDESTALLMTRFYARIGRGDPPGLALQRAKAELRADARFAHPFFWAAFLLYGVD